ncbi:putative glutathione S-transferase [Capsicum annuum]|uniref:Probable glutathione S-transferase n=1 Tax=Capsicum annuum TaxID=4072 RepID=A0A1U8DRC4_CAPAN|nr:probable glutathione S-transferase [Capsicum annuum]KAF3622206.1 putative glutathione S-transferase [Capsicum annuum]KAF3665067.1 putative glutathione S-transferase [Capsicum annuum]PHT94608.1 putative glutathione S-transferase [Capsicum annuum]
MAEVKVHGIFAGPFNKRVELALKLKGVEYEYIEEDRSNKSAELVKYNPIYKQVPVLVHNGKPICESLIILEYIDETWESAAPLLPNDPYQRSIARFCANLIDDKLMGAMYKVCYGKGEEKEKGLDEVSEVLKYLDNELQDKKFFGGDNIGFLDIVASYIALWFGAIQEAIGMELLTKQKFTKLSKWIDEFLCCGIVMEHLPTRESLVPLYIAQFEAAKASS